MNGVARPLIKPQRRMVSIVDLLNSATQPTGKMLLARGLLDKIKSHF